METERKFCHDGRISPPPQSINQAINQASKRAKALGRGSASYAWKEGRKEESECLFFLSLSDESMKKNDLHKKMHL